MAAQLIKVSANSVNGQSMSPSQDRWVNPAYINSMQATAANGAVFRYSPPGKGYIEEYKTDTAASAIATLADA